MLYLIEQGVLSVEDTDVAVSYGPGLRWGVMGQSLQWHLGGGAGGIKHFMDHLMEPLAGMMKVLGTPNITPRPEANHHRRRPARSRRSLRRPARKEGKRGDHRPAPAAQCRKRSSAAGKKPVRKGRPKPGRREVFTTPLLVPSAGSTRRATTHQQDRTTSEELTMDTRFCDHGTRPANHHRGRGLRRSRGGPRPEEDFGPRAPHRQDQPPRLPAAPLPGGHLGPVPRAHRGTDPPRVAPAGQHHRAARAPSPEWM